VEQWERHLRAALDESSGNLLYRIWLLEGARVSVGDNKEARHSVNSLESKLALDCDIQGAVKEAEADMKIVHKLLEQSSALDSEEWILVLSYLSAAYSLTLFCERHELDGRIILLPTVTNKIFEATCGLRLPVYRRALTSMRRHHPNPLPNAVDIKSV
jgi:hypothetical protein